MSFKTPGQQFTQRIHSRSRTVSSAKHCQFFFFSALFLWCIKVKSCELTRGAVTCAVLPDMAAAEWVQPSEVFICTERKPLPSLQTITGEVTRSSGRSWRRAPQYVNQMCCSPSKTLSHTHCVSDLMGFISQRPQFKEVHSWKTQLNLV